MQKEKFQACNREGMKVDKLYIIIPAYNEEETIESVAKEWHKITLKVGESARLVVIDDGSKDDTFQLLEELKKILPQLIILTKENGGHGATLLYGYQYAMDHNADFIFQTDSDGQTISDEFWEFWEARNEYDAQIGFRKKRQDGLGRIFVTKVLKLVIYIQFRLRIKDANTPFRLIKGSVMKEIYPLIPKDYKLSNVLLTILLTKYNYNLRFLPITFRARQGGVNSINMKRIIKIGKETWRDFGELREVVKNAKTS